MKQFILILAVGLIGVVGCNVVTEPYGPQVDYGWDPAYDQEPVYNDTTILPKRRIFLEDFTGHTCPNCPEGQEIASDIKKDNPEDIVLVAIHTGPFAKPDTSNPDKPYPGEFETVTGDNLRNTYRVSGFPSGLLNRSEINGDHIIDYKQWENTVNSLLADPDYMAPRFKFKLVTTFNNELGNRTVRIQYQVVALQPVSGNIAIVAFLAENRIISPQKDSRQNDPYVADYEHNHLLRVGFPGNGSGRTIFTDPQMGDFVEVTDPSDFLITGVDDSWVAENMEVIVFVYNSNTGEILGTELMDMVN